MSFATVQSINLDKAMSDISGESLVIVTKTVESSAYLNKDISLYPSISRSFKNMLKRYGPLTLPCVVPLLTKYRKPSDRRLMSDLIIIIIIIITDSQQMKHKVLVEYNKELKAIGEAKLIKNLPASIMGLLGRISRKCWRWSLQTSKLSNHTLVLIFDYNESILFHTCLCP